MFILDTFASLYRGRDKGRFGSHDQDNGLNNLLYRVTLSGMLFNLFSSILAKSVTMLLNTVNDK